MAGWAHRKDRGDFRTGAREWLRLREGAGGSGEAGKIIRRGGLDRDGLFEPANRGGLHERGVLEDAPQTSSFLAPIKVRSRSANSAASNGFLNVSLMLDRSKLVELPSSGSRAIRITSAKALLRRRF